MYDLITCRHSARKYKKEKVKEEDIQKIIEAGLSAPSGGNTQPWHFTVINGKNEIDKLVRICKDKFINSGIEWRQKWATQESFNPFYDPSVIIVVSNKNSVRNSNEDCCFALQNMTLMAESLGLSSCIIKDICWAIDKSNQEEYGISEEYDCFMCLAVGYAEVKLKTRKKFDYTKVNYL